MTRPRYVRRLRCVLFALGLLAGACVAGAVAGVVR